MNDMHEGVCPKCSSNEVYFGRSAAGQAGVIYTSVWGFFPIKMVYYICTNCGYTESYVLEKRALQDIAKKWQRAKWLRVNDSKRKNDE